MNATPSEVIKVTIQVASVFDQLNICYFISGSVASSIWGEPRSTNDIDFIALISQPKAQQFIKIIKDDFYISESSVQHAIQSFTSFNIIHLATMVKSDIFVANTREYEKERMQRRIQKPVTPDPDPKLYVASPEDLILSKLDWYKKGNQTSERQWLDVLGILKVQTKLDMSYLKHWAKQLDLQELLNKALQEADV